MPNRLGIVDEEHYREASSLHRRALRQVQPDLAAGKCVPTSPPAVTSAPSGTPHWTPSTASDLILLTLLTG